MTLSARSHSKKPVKVLQYIQIKTHMGSFVIISNVERRVREIDWRGIERIRE